MSDAPTASAGPTSAGETYMMQAANRWPPISRSTGRELCLPEDLWWNVIRPYIDPLSVPITCKRDDAILDLRTDGIAVRKLYEHFCGYARGSGRGYFSVIPAPSLSRDLNEWFPRYFDGRPMLVAAAGDVTGNRIRVVSLDWTCGNLRGELPLHVLERLNCLCNLSLAANKRISGRLDRIDWSAFPFLQCLDLGRCQFSGPIPDSLGRCTQLRELDLANGNKFTGPFPLPVRRGQTLWPLLNKIDVGRRGYGNGGGTTTRRNFSDQKEIRKLLDGMYLFDEQGEDSEDEYDDDEEDEYDEGGGPGCSLS